MIALLLFGVLIAVFVGISIVFPYTTLATIPYFGADLRETLITMMQYWNSAQETVPYLTALWSYFVYGVLGFEMLMLVAKAIFGFRLPAHTPTDR